MPAKRLSMRKIREIIRLHYEQSLSKRAIAQSCQMAASTVCEYLKRARKAGLGWPLPSELDDEEKLERVLFPEGEEKNEAQQKEPDWEEIYVELRRKNVTKQLLWEEYRERHPDGYQYSSFCKRYKKWAAKLNPTMRQTHTAGEKMFVDFSGDGLTITDPKTGEHQNVRLFVAVLGASNLTFVEPVLNEKLDSWLSCHVRAFEYFGGTSKIVIPDNPKALITSPSFYEPEINRDYNNLAQYYGVAVIPARPRKPRDKAKVEQGVLLAQRWIIAALRNHIFSSLDEVRQEVRKCLEKLNNRPMRRINKSRRQLFEEIECEKLKPLPTAPYEPSHWARPRVNIDYHVAFEDHFYSVPYNLVHQEVELRVTEKMVEVLFKGRRIASHPRSYEKNKSTTNLEHMPASHRAYAEWTPARILDWMSRIGPNAVALGEQIIKRRAHVQQGFRSCLGIIRLKERFGVDRLERACARALHFSAFSYRSVEAILKNNLDCIIDDDALDQEKPALPLHENLRGSRYYQ